MILLAAALAMSASKPAWLDDRIAGYMLYGGPSNAPLAVRDRKSGFFVLREKDCDGAMMTLLLTRDRKEISKAGYVVAGIPREDPDGMKLKATDLKNLSTGKGISIGDSPESVRARLGVPKEDSPSGSRDPFESLSYRAIYNRTHFEEVYTFKAGKLIEVKFSLDQMDLDE